MTEEALIQRALDGDREAFAALVESYKVAVFNLAYRMLGRAEDAEDVAQETFLRAFSRIKTYDPEKRFSTWLLSIATHLCIDHLRRRPAVSLEDQPGFDVADNVREEPEQVSLRQEQRQEVQSLINALPDKYRVPIVLRYWYDQSYQEIAKSLGLTESLVKTRLFRARQMLADEVGRRGGMVNVLPGFSGKNV